MWESFRLKFSLALAKVMLNFFQEYILSSADCKSQPFRQNLTGIPSDCQTRLDPDQARHNVGLDLGPICLKRL